MSYVQDGIIEASDFNTFEGQTDPVYGVGFGDSGYGQTAITIPTVVGGFIELIKSVEWTALQYVVDVLADHQGTAKVLLPPTTVLEVGDLITAHDGITNAFDMPQMLTDVTANRLIADAGSVSLFLSRHSDSLTTSWNTQVITEVQCLFSTADEARYFFNSGGQIKFRLSRSGGSATSQNTAWTDLLSSIGTIFMDFTETTSTGSGSGSSLGYYDLSEGVYQDIFTASVGSGAYAGNNVRIRAQVLNVDGANGDNGRTIRFEIQLNDTFTGPSDIVDGTIDFDLDEQRATTFLTIASFTSVGVIIPLQSTTTINPVVLEATSYGHTSRSTGGGTGEYTNVASGSTAGRTAIVGVSAEDNPGDPFVTNQVILNPGGANETFLTKVIEREGGNNSPWISTSIWIGAIPDALTGNITVRVNFNDGINSGSISMVTVLGLQSESSTDQSSGDVLDGNVDVDTDGTIAGDVNGIIIGVMCNPKDSQSHTWSSITKRSDVASGSGSGDHVHGFAMDLLPIARVAAIETVSTISGNKRKSLCVAAFR